MDRKNQEELPSDLTKEQLLAMYRKMQLIRGFEGTAKKYFEAGEIGGFLHLSVGQEAVPVGTCSALRKDDYITSTHRGHGDVLSKGCEVKRMFAELYGRTDGYCKGKGGSMHIADFSQGIIGANGIVSSGIPIAVGAALSIRMRGTDQVAVSFFGDGATAEGSFHEALNLASLWQVPVIFVCQNNLYALSQPWSHSARDGNLVERAQSYHIPAESVDGMDVIAVYRSVEKAVDRARSGDGPTFIEARTYRFMGHYVGDPGAYMPEEEQEEWRKKDAIAKLRRQLKMWGYLTDKVDEQIATDIEAELQDGIEYARSSVIPEPREALNDVYVHFDYLGRPLKEESNHA